MARPLSIGIVGAGAFGRQHARAIERLADARLVAASARSAERLASFTAEFGGTGYTDYRELLRDPDVDVVCIVLPHNVHGEATIAAAGAGKAILLEKPMAASVEECDAINRAVERTGVPFMVAHPYRYMASYREAKLILDSGEIGEPVLCSAAMVKDWTFEQRMPWHLVRGGGMWLTNGVHLVDRLSWLVGSLPRDVRAHVGTHFHNQEVDDIGVGMITFESGVVGLIRAVGYRVGADDQWTEVQGTRGALRLSHAEGVFLARGDRWEQVARADADRPVACLVEQWTAFLGYLRNGGLSPVSGSYGRRVVATIEAGVRSSRSGHVEQVPTG